MQRESKDISPQSNQQLILQKTENKNITLINTNEQKGNKQTETTTDKQTWTSAIKVKKGKENSPNHGETAVGSSREVSSTTVSTKVGLLRNGFKRCPFTLKLLSVD